MNGVSVNDLRTPLSDVSPAPIVSSQKGTGFNETFQTASRKMNEKASNEQTVNRKDDWKDSKADAYRQSDKMASVKKAGNGSRDEMLSEEDMEALNRAAEDMITAVSEITGASREEIISAMEENSLTVADLFTKEGLGSLLSDLKNLEEPILLVTDQEICKELGDLMEAGQNILSQLADETEKPVEVIKENLQTIPVTENGLQTDEEVSIAKPGEEVSEPVEKIETGAEISKADISDQKDSNESDAFTNNASGNGNQPAFLSDENVIELPSNGQDEAQSRVSTQEIFDQIGEYLKSVKGEDFESLEMQLKPESLGTLQIRVTAKNGNLTASFLAQNEAVKAALEAQVTTLKEQLEQQGVKVEAVEVTVETHKFESAMQQNNQSNEQSFSNAKHSGTRSINLNEDLDEEGLTEEEQLAVEMMQANGNTVDYKA
ncbi:MAG: flagellar hook-length control protein FliK [Lachnospiraceae bacterium]|nr:flagellar hook-length control protein FliK [Lachnospiraceae bacterium]